MIRYRHMAVLAGALWLAPVLILAQEQITEKDVVSTLIGRGRIGVSGRSIGVALHITISPDTASGGAPQSDDALYKAITPLARALAAEVRAGSRYVMHLSPHSPLPPEEIDRMGQHLSDMIGRFLTTSFAIPSERLSLQVVPPPPTAAGQTSPRVGLQRWRLEVLRQD